MHRGGTTYIGHEDKVLDDDNTLFDIELCENHFGHPVGQLI
jgi:hypothetical protein